MSSMSACAAGENRTDLVPSVTGLARNERVEVERLRTSRLLTFDQSGSEPVYLRLMLFE